MSGKTKILYFLNTTTRAGVEEHLLSLLRGLDRSSFTAVLVCPGQLLDQFGADIPGDVRVYGLCLADWKNLAAIREFIAILRQERPDIVHSHMFSSSMFGSTLAKASIRAATVETCHGPERWRTSWIKRSYVADTFFLKFVDRFIAVSAAAGEHLAGAKRVAPDKITVIRNGRELPSYQSPAGAEFRLPDAGGRLRIGVIGRLDAQKGHKYLIEAAPAIMAGTDAVILLAGDGALKAELESQAKALGVADRVVFLGYQKQIPSILRQLDVVVLPSLYEGLPLVAIEASAAGVPIVATAVDGTKEVVLHEKTGLLVPPADPGALAAAVLRLCGDGALRTRLAGAARERAEKEFSIDKQMNETEAVYSGLCARSEKKVSGL